ncbi:hypothetical protein LTR85_002707 [Meristemomyces frigidus]|nr:hypothetical protein LTR85_002707 [Meristemomyces frigidus]
MSSSSMLHTLRMSGTTALVVSVCIVDSVTIAYDGSVMGSLNVMPSYINYFNLNTGTTGLNTCATFIGAILAGPFTGMVIDRWGRKSGIYVAGITNIIGAILAAAAQNSAMFVQTPIQTTFALEPSTWAWRIPTLIQGFPALVAMMILLILPESPRWLIYQDRTDEALDVLARINATDRADTLVQLQYQEVMDTIAYEKAEGHQLGFREIVRTKPNRKRLALALSVSPIVMLTGSNIITYYFGSMLDQAGVTSSTTQLEINVILSAWQLVIALLGSYMAEKLGRRVLALSSLASCTAFFYLLAGMTARYGNSSSLSGSYATVACMFLYTGAYSFGLTPLSAMYAPEVLSYNMRATGIASQTILSKSCGLLVTMAFPYALADIGWKTYVMNASWNIPILAYIYFQWVETKGMTLEEVDACFDGEKHSSVPDLKNVQKLKTEVIVGESMSEQGVETQVVLPGLGKSDKA